MANIFGRQVILPLTNKSGGGVVAGDVVILDSANNESFTTTTTAGSTIAVGIAQETIANNATGRVLVAGYAALVNVNASVTRLNYGKTHTVAKQATDSGSSRVTGTFCIFLKGGTTPSAYIYPTDLAGAALTDPTSNRGEIIRRGAAGLQALQAKTLGKTLIGDGTDVISDYPPGTQMDYVEFTSNVNVTATVEASGNTVVSGTSQAYAAGDYWVEFFSQDVSPNPTAGAYLILSLWDGATELGNIAIVQDPTGATSVAPHFPVLAKRKVTLSAATHQLIIKGHTSGGQPGSVQAGSGGVATRLPGYILVTKA